MKTRTILIGIVLVAAQIICLDLQAQGTLFVSNLSQPSSGGVLVASNSLVAQPFVPGASPLGYGLSSIQIQMSSPSGNPQGLAVAIYSGDRKPQTPIGTLSGTDPTTGGVFTFTASGITLSPQTLYWVVLSAGTAVGGHGFNWNRSGNQNYSSLSGWSMGLSFFSSADGANWSQNTPNPMQFAINATAIPEPSLLALVGLGGLWLASRLKQRRQFSFQLFTHEQHRRVFPD